MADEATVRDVVRFLAQYHGREIGETAARVYVEAFANTGEALLGDAVQRWCETHGPTSLIPSVQDLRTCCRDLVAARRGVEKRETPGTATLGARPPAVRAGIARATGELVRRSRLVPGHPDYLDSAGMAAEMRRLEGEFPGCGWWDAAARLTELCTQDRRQSEQAQRRYRELGLRIGRGFGAAGDDEALA